MKFRATYVGKLKNQILVFIKGNECTTFLFMLGITMHFSRSCE